jgi:DNA polymerase-3 subunit alpha
MTEATALLAHALAVRSEHSRGESIIDIAATVESAKQLGYSTVAVVDNMNVSCMGDLFAACAKHGVKPILGVTLQVYDDPLWRKPKKGEQGPTTNPMHTLKVYVKTDQGLKQLYRLLSLASTEDHFYYNPRVGFEEVLDHLSHHDVVVTTGDFHSLFSHAAYKERAALLAAQFGSSFWIEVPLINTPLFDTINLRAMEVAQQTGAQCFATYPTLYPQGDADSADVMRAITSNNKMTDGWLPRPYVRDFSLEAPERILQRYKAIKDRGDVPAEFLRSALHGVAIFAAQQFFTFTKLAPCLPTMATDEFTLMTKHCVDGWQTRFRDPVMGYKPEPALLEQVYKPRLKYELGVIQKMGFSGYFLLVRDIVNWSKSQGISVGPGRGSVGGSLIAYLLGITDIDPIRFDLLFERFINPGRVDLPDADLDFMSRRRHEVIVYIEEKYGKENVAGISNYSTLGPASAIRDVSRVHGLEPFDYACSKQTEKEHGASVSLSESVVNVPDIAKFSDRFPVVWRHALALEGRLRNLGTHAAGVIVAGEPVVNRAVVETRSGGQVVNWDKRTVEDHGLIKMDILGLSTLDTLTLAKDYIKVRRGVDLDYLRLPLDDQKVLDAFGRGETVGVFQFESLGMRKLLTQLAEGGRLTFDDLAAVTSLFRPGPLGAGMCDQYVAIKQGKTAPFYEHANLKGALEPTFGVLIYQEQVMRICRDYAGFTLEEADNVRKAMGKKDADKMASYKEKFIEGAHKTSGVSDLQSGMLWEKIAGFAAYGFNKSHAIEYSVLSWWAMYVKTHYPAEFFAAAMTVVDDNDKLATLVTDARRQNIKVLPPDINGSTGRIEIRSDTELLAPFQAVKGISDNTAKAIVELRKIAGGAFTSKAQLEAIVTDRKMGAKCNVRHRECLERVGAFHSIEGGLPPLHADRLKDRIELMPGFTVETVKATRSIVADTYVMTKLIRLHEECKACDKCSLQGNPHPQPRMGKTPKFMVVFDSPGWQEEKAGKMLEGDAAEYLKAALKDAGLSPNDGYYTSLVKSQRPKGSKALTTEQINGCSGHLQQEIQVLKPPVILAMGAATAKFFAPTFKGNTSELTGKVIFDPKLDASIVFGINPAQVVFDGTKIALLQTVASKTADICN